jgi:hypothetical protein
MVDARRNQWLGLPSASDHDPLYRFHQWQANLRVLEVTEIKTVPYVPLSRPFVERLLGMAGIATRSLFLVDAIWQSISYVQKQWG